MLKRIKSQAALEFLTTYAWAFLVIIIMIGALAYFGVLSPSKLLPDRCNFGNEIGCNKDLMVVKNEAITEADATDVDTILDDPVESESGAGQTLSMRLENNFGTQVMITDATITTDISSAGTCYALFDNDPAGGAIDPGTGGTSILDVGTADDNKVTWNGDATLTFIARCAAGDTLVKKEKVKFNIEVNYYPTSAGSAYGKKIFGEVFTTIQ